MEIMMMIVIMMDNDYNYYNYVQLHQSTYQPRIFNLSG